jgi:signal transduction histidine kinase
MLIVMLSALIVVVLIYRKREKNLINRLQLMINRAIDGTYEITKIDESTLSALENSMKRYIEGCIVSYKNLSEQKEIIQTLVSDISHQTVTPISNILLYSQLLEEKNHEIKDYEEIYAIREQTEKLSFLITSLVKISRLETGIITVEPKQNKIQELLDTVMKQLKAKAMDKNITINYEYSEAEAMFDLKWTMEAINNIVDNAIKYSQTGGYININSVTYSFYCRINIKDNGFGIAENEYSKIFGRFYRSQTVSEEEGLGIGLYLARQIISLQGGYIKVASKEGEGSVFSVFLPLKESIKTVTS